MVTTPGRILLNSLLPEKFRDYGTLDKKGISALYDRLAKQLPSEDYAKIAANTARLGNRIAYEYGGQTSVHLRDLVIPPEFREFRERMRADLNKIVQNPKLSDKEKRQLILDYTHKATETLDKDIVDYLADQGNSFGVMVKNGIRGNPTQLRQMVFGDLLTVDSKLRTIPMPTLHSYAEGVTPLEYWNASHGGRYGYVQIQMATPKAGYLSRRARQIAHRVVVTQEDCGNPEPAMVSADDNNNIGSLLARDVKGKDGKVYKKNTVLTADILDDLSGNIPVRSATTCKASEGICAKCAGVHESGTLPEVGDIVGLNDINSFMLDATQAAISCLHGDTLVRMADLSEKRIADIKVGDMVLGVCEKHPRCTPVRVLNTFNHGPMPMVLTVFKDEESLYQLVSTTEHKILGITNSWEHEQQRADSIDTAAVVNSYREVFAPKISQTSLGNFTAYDIEVDHPDHLFLLANGLVVSNSKHVGGEEKSAKRIKKGFEAIEQFIDMPENFVGGAVMVDKDGRVGNIRKAPQGGQYVAVGDTEYWVPPDAELKVKSGDDVEAGDPITDGVLDISKIVEHKGIGEARRQFVRGLSDVLADNKLSTQRRSLESVARGYLNKVRITDPDGVLGRIAGDYADYDDIAAHWEPRESSRKVSVNAASGYLEQPALHYTIGTRITPKVRTFLRENGVTHVTVNPEPPPFEPVTVRAKTWNTTDKDFLTALAGENLTKTFIDRAARGANTYKNSTSYFPQMAFESFAGEKVDI